MNEATQEIEAEVLTDNATDDAAVVDELLDQAPNKTKTFGGKGIIKRWIMEALCEYPHKIYVEPFGGGASSDGLKYRNGLFSSFRRLPGRLHGFRFVFSNKRIPREPILCKYPFFSRLQFDTFLESTGDNTSGIARLT